MHLARTSRRDLLVASAAFAASRAWTWIPQPPRSADEVEDAVRWIMTTPREPAVQRGARELCAGMDPTLLLGAVLVASARDIRTDLPVFNHAALSVSAIDQLTASASPAERRRDVLWCLDYFKESQESEARSDDWRVVPIEAKKLPKGAKARAALIDALEHWDREAADVAIAGFVRSAPIEEVYLVVWEYGTRCVANLGHKGIYAALSRRALPLAGERFAEDVLRSVVSSFFLDGRSYRAEPFERSRELVLSAMTARDARPESDLGPARDLLASIRESTPNNVPATVAELLRDGAAPSTLWSAVIAAASEIAVANTGIGPLHAFTSANSLHYIALHAPNPRLALLALLQGAAWVAEFRSGLSTAEKAQRIDDAQQSPLTLDMATKTARSRSDDVHEFKLAAAALEEARINADWVRPHIVAVLATHLPVPGRPDSARVQRIADALAVASSH